MSFTPGIPTVGQSLGITRDPIRNNFTTIDDTISVNHVSMNDLPGQGKHKFLQMPTQGVITPPSGDPVTAVDEIGIYTKGNGAGTRTFMRQQANGDIIQMSGVTPFLADADRAGYTFLANGLVLVYGNASITGSSPITVTYPNSFAFSLDGVSALPFSIVITQYTNNLQTLQSIAVEKSSIAEDLFKVLTTGAIGGGSRINYIAIGPKT